MASTVRGGYALIRCPGGNGPSLWVTGCVHNLDGIWGSVHFGVTAEIAPATENP